jgi:hypothetical protein
MIVRCTKSRFGQEFRYEIDFFPNTGLIRESTPIKGNYYNGSDDPNQDDVRQMIVKSAKRGESDGSEDEA